MPDRNKIGLIENRDGKVSYFHRLGYEFITHVSGDRHIARLRLGQLRNAGHAQIVEAAMESGPLERMTPRRAPSLSCP